MHLMDKNSWCTGPVFTKLYWMYLISDAIWLHVIIQFTIEVSLVYAQIWCRWWMFSEHHLQLNLGFRSGHFVYTGEGFSLISGFRNFFVHRRIIFYWTFKPIKAFASAIARKQMLIFNVFNWQIYFVCKSSISALLRLKVILFWEIFRKIGFALTFVIEFWKFKFAKSIFRLTMLYTIYLHFHRDTGRSVCYAFS